MTLGLRIAVSVLIVVLLTALVGYAGYASIRRLVTDNQAVEQAHQAERRLDQLSSQVKDAEAGCRGFVITADQEYLQSYDSAEATIPIDLDALGQLTLHPAIQQSLEAVTALIDQDVFLMDELIRARRTSGFRAAQALMQTGALTATKDTIRRRIGEVESRLNTLVANRRATTAHSTRWAVLFIMSALTTAMVLSVSAGVLVYQTLAERDSMMRQRALFAAMINHELRNALTSVYGWAERLVRGKASPESRELAAREVFEGAERTISLLTNLLDFSRLEAGKMRPVLRDVDPHEAVARALAAVRPAAEAKGVLFEDQCAPALPTLRTDSLRLQQILTNLLSNAIRHSPQGASVTVEVTREGAALVTRVVDRGPGLSPEQVRHLFEPFERFDRDSGVGSGLGLAVSRRLAEVLGGELRVQTSAGSGATFILSLPAEAKPGVRAQVGFGPS